MAAPLLHHRDRNLAEVDEFAFEQPRGVGVHFLKTKSQPLGLWQARVKLPDGRKTHRSLSVRRFGKREAFRLAVAARAKLLELVPEQPYLYNATAKKLAATFSPLTGA